MLIDVVDDRSEWVPAFCGSTEYLITHDHEGALAAAGRHVETGLLLTESKSVLVVRADDGIYAYIRLPTLEGVHAVTGDVQVGPFG